MKVSIDGMRRNIAKAHDKAIQSLEGITYPSEFHQDQTEAAFGEMRALLSALMGCFDNDCPDDWTELDITLDHLGIDHLSTGQPEIKS